MIIETLIAFAFVAAAVAFVVPDEYAGRAAFALSLVPLVGSLYMWYGFDASGNALLQGGELAYETTAQWFSVAGYQIRWYVGVDGISLPLVVLTTVLTTLAILSAWTPIDERQSQFYGLVLFMEASLIGVFSALDFFLWFAFWEAVLVPMYFLVGVWGGPRRDRAAIKLFVYTNVGSLAMFIAFTALVFGLGDAVSTFGLPEIAQALRASEGGQFFGVDAELVKTAAFAVIFAGFAVKSAVVPLHTWLPDAYTEAPAPVTVLLAGVLLKMGTYALLRFNFTMLPDVAREYATIIAVLAVVCVLYGALVALAQRDLKRIVAYSSVASTGFILLGLVAYNLYGVGGATFLMVTHGFVSGLMFMAIGVIYEQTRTRIVTDVSGLGDRMPVTTAVFVAGAFAYMGLPLMANFAAEFFVFAGGFRSTVVPNGGMALLTALAMFGIVIIAGYFLFAIQRTIMGPFHLDTDYEVRRARGRDVFSLAVLLLCVIALGVAPDQFFFEMIKDAVAPLVEQGGGS